MCSEAIRLLIVILYALTLFHNKLHTLFYYCGFTQTSIFPGNEIFTMCVVIAHIDSFKLSMMRYKSFFINIFFPFVGDSAGGNLAMSVVLKITREKDKTLPTIKAQGLLYPLLQGIDFSTPSYRVYGASTRSPSMTSEKGLAEVCGWYAFGHRVNTDKLLLLSNTPSFQKSSARERIDYNLLPKQFVEEVNPSSTKEGNDTFFNEVKHILLDPYFSPLLASDSDLKRFPKSYVLTTEYDVLRDDGYMVARRLDKNRILVVHRHWPYDGHGLLSLTGYLSNARPALVEFSHFLVENL